MMFMTRQIVGQHVQRHLGGEAPHPIPLEQIA